MMVLERPLICFDLETTGTDTAEDRIVQIAFVHLAPDGTRTRKSRLINPGRPIPAGATAVHGLSDQDVAGAPAFAQVARSLHALLSDVDLTGYNVQSFDVPLLAAEFARCDLQWPSDDQVVVDAYMIFKRQEPRKLAKALEFYTGEIMEDAHNAVADAEAALDVLVAQAQRYGERQTPVDDGLCWQASLVELEALGKDPDWIDDTGKVKWVDNEATINFGKWDGKPLNQVDLGYFAWVMKQDFPHDFKLICENAQRGIFPTREGDNATTGWVRHPGAAAGDDVGVHGGQVPLPERGLQGVEGDVRGRNDGDMPVKGGGQTDSGCAEVDGRTVGGLDAPGDDHRDDGGVQPSLPGVVAEPRKRRPEPHVGTASHSGGSYDPIPGAVDPDGAAPEGSGPPDGGEASQGLLDPAVQLDKLGEVVGLARGGLDDTAYRTRLRAKHVQSGLEAASEARLYPCSLCDSTEGSDFVFASALTFDGKVHKRCLELYGKMKPLWWDLYHHPDGEKRQCPNGYNSVLEGLGAPQAADSVPDDTHGAEIHWDIHSPEFKVVQHAWDNCGTLLERMAQ